VHQTSCKYNQFFFFNFRYSNRFYLLAIFWALCHVTHISYINSRNGRGFTTFFKANSEDEDSRSSEKLGCFLPVQHVATLKSLCSDYRVL
jgi:hypothetical protein